MPEKKNSKYKAVAALGNPGKEFDDTYHNAGFMALSHLIKKLSSEKEPPKFRPRKNLFEYAAADDLIFIRPLVFMNESGVAVKAALREFKIKPEETIIIHDDSDIPLGDFKLSFGRNSGGHRGVQSVIDSLRSKDFTRIRIGIRPEAERQRKKAGSFVLARITKKNKVTLDGVFEKIAAQISTLLQTSS
jgi:PTH1 family peptidyl-tRNA hydrolase